MNMACIDECKAYIERNLSEHRLAHTYGVRDLAVELARAYGTDPGRAEIAALLHDMAKPLSQEEADREIARLGLPGELLGSRDIAHGHIAAAWAEERYGISDREILDPVRYHTTGRRGMSLPEKILFVADTTEPGRTYAEAAELRERAFTDLQYVYRYILLWTRDNLRERGLELSRDTREAVAEVLNEHE